MILQGNDPYRGASFSLGNRLMRVVWGVVYLMLFRSSPRPLHAWRSFLLRLFGAKVGSGCHVYPAVKIWAPWNLVLGDHVGVANGVNLYSMDKINVGDFAVISQGAHLCTGSHDYNSSNFQLITSPIAIGSRVWLCAESFVGPGVSIADGSVVAARSVVSKTINEPWLVWAGVPVKQVGVRDKQRVLNQK
ncbi:acetyltransferase [Methylotenera sp. G11]|uniref:acetyltransferase n=1 Tax=Methylotenera sp. G11 TaxID=1506585 RepID=UPI0006484695|nr:acetyltransferase [Methylotenera sp. G11]